MTVKNMVESALANERDLGCDCNADVEVSQYECEVHGRHTLCNVVHADRCRLTLSRAAVFN